MPSEMGNPNCVTASSSGGWASRRAGSALWMLLQAQNEFWMYSLKKPSGHLVLLVVFSFFEGSRKESRAWGEAHLLARCNAQTTQQMQRRGGLQPGWSISIPGVRERGARALSSHTQH